MAKNFYLEQALPLFACIDEQEMASLTKCLGAHSKSYGKGQLIMSAGDLVQEIGIVLSGSVQLVNDDFFGNRSIIGLIGPGGMFGEGFSCAGEERLPLSVEAAADCEVLFVDYRRVITTCPSACVFHSRLVENMLSILAHKNVQLTEKIRHISKRSTREKLLSYLAEESQKAGSNEFTIPFSRQELADYLCVERSAMSAELSRLRQAGILDTERSHFQLLVEGHELGMN
jgi:CRP/FNR family transcriptional regulator, dissimilatory nitrate respiration regulator